MKIIKEKRVYYYCCLRISDTASFAIKKRVLKPQKPAFSLHFQVEKVRFQGKNHIFNIGIPF